MELSNINMPMIKIAWSEVYRYQLPEGHRFPMEKYVLLPEQLKYEGTFDNENFFEPSILALEDILLTHTAEYWDKLENLMLSKREIRDIGFPVNKKLIYRGRIISQGTIECALFALENGVALNIAGGTHHAYADRGEGFCVLNDFAIASNYLLKNKLCKQILIVDLDVHQGNGNAKIFENDTRVFTFSMHGEKNYPLRKEKSDLDIGLKDGTNDDSYLNILTETLPQLINKIKPDIIFYLSGVDVLADDKLGRLSLSLEGCKARDTFVFEQARKYDIPIAVSMGGGYTNKVSTLIEAHANTFRAVKEVY